MKNIKEVERICSHCAGSGEGKYDGSTCFHCYGMGFFTEYIDVSDCDEDEDEDEEFLND